MNTNTAMKKAPILVTGATGFIGSHLVRLLIEQGEEKVVASNVSGSTRNLDDVLDKVEIVPANIGNFTSVLRLIEAHKPRIVYHIGAMLAPACDAEPEVGIQTNAVGTYYILEAARLFGVQQVIFASSMSIFSGAYSSESVLNDFSVTRPETVYGSAKLFSENMGLFYKRQYGFDYRGLRLPNILGPGTTTHGYLEYLNKTLEESAKGKPYTVYVAPHIRIPFIHVRDAARAFIELAQAPLSAIRAVNYIVLGPRPFPTAQEVVNTVTRKIPGATIDFNVNEPISNTIETVTQKPFDDRYAVTEWGWQSQYDLDAIVDDFINTYRTYE